jgi:hypothetical protein
LNAPSANQFGAVDASAFTGIVFDAKGGGTTFWVGVDDSDTELQAGQCDVVQSGCYDYPSVDITAAQPPRPALSRSTWQTFQVPFFQLLSQGFGMPRSAIGSALPKNAIYQIVFKIYFTNIAPLQPWELWVDNLSFY